MKVNDAYISRFSSDARDWNITATPYSLAWSIYTAWSERNEAIR